MIVPGNVLKRGKGGKQFPESPKKGLIGADIVRDQKRYGVNEDFSVDSPFVPFVSTVASDLGAKR